MRQQRDAGQSIEASKSIIGEIHAQARLVEGAWHSAWVFELFALGGQQLAEQQSNRGRRVLTCLN